MRGYLLDTQALIWFLEGNPNLPLSMRAIISTPENRVFLSIASIWEIGIKLSIGKLKLAEPLERIIARLDEEEIILLPVEPAHVLKIVGLEFHHKDPFDRIMIAQSVVENLTLISCDEVFGAYEIRVLW